MVTNDDLIRWRDMCARGARKAREQNDYETAAALEASVARFESFFVPTAKGGSA
jgi:hypothetical protein